ncbi:MAG: helix-turn-helix domain-containing protein [Myxococcaceae bacterium]
MKRNAKTTVYRVHGEDVEVTTGSDNVFADLEVPDAEDLLVKTDLAIAAAKAISARGLTQTKAAAITGLPQPKVSKVVSGLDLRGISAEKLMAALARLGNHVVISIEPARGRRAGSIRVVPAQKRPARHRRRAAG